MFLEWNVHQHRIFRLRFEKENGKRSIFCFKQENEKKKVFSLKTVNEKYRFSLKQNKNKIKRPVWNIPKRQFLKHLFEFWDFKILVCDKLNSIFIEDIMIKRLTNAIFSFTQGLNHRKHYKIIYFLTNLWFYNPDIFGTQCSRPLLFQTLIYLSSLKYQRFSPSGCQDIGI